MTFRICHRIMLFNLKFIFGLLRRFIFDWGLLLFDGGGRSSTQKSTQDLSRHECSATIVYISIDRGIQ